MIIKDLKIFSQNICKNYLLIETILENNKNFDILFIQELPWLVIKSIPSTTSVEGDEVVSMPFYPFWITIARYSNNYYAHSRDLTYINSKLISSCFSLRKDIYNHKDINLVSFIFFLLNVYSNNHQTALKYLKNTEVKLNNVIIMMGNFNIRDSD